MPKAKARAAATSPRSAGREVPIQVPGHGAVSGLLSMPDSPRALFVFAHGAGAGMRHPFMDALVARLSARGIGSLRYQFPYMDAGSRRPDPQPLLLATVRAAAEAGRKAAPGVALIAGGKSMGGRMTTLAAAESPLDGVRGIVLVGFPLHGMGQPPNTTRAEHLMRVTVPSLFLQGTRDTLADLDLMRGVCERLGPRATLHVVEGGDHSFHVLKRTGRTDDQVLDELADTTASWLGRL
jgi:uncharacterized protein